MFQSAALKSHLESSQTIQGESLVIAEWNLNDPENIEKVGNYFRPGSNLNPPNPNTIYDPNDRAGLYTGGTDADVEVYGPYDDFDEPTVLLESKIKTKLLYSLDDCFRPHRPRSGINYARNLPGAYLTGNTYNSARPRYYMGDYGNNFKYWSSFRESPTNGQKAGSTTSGKGLKGIAKPRTSGRCMIEDVSPFVVYENDIPTNKIVMKVQTNIGTYNRGTVRTRKGDRSDPFYGSANATVPNVWRMQALYGNTWNTIKEFNENDVRSDGSPIFAADGYVELTYGIQFPSDYASMQKRYKGMLISSTNLPPTANQGDYYLVVPSDGDLGSVHIWTTEWETFFPTYGWSLREDYGIPDETVSSLTSPPTYDSVGDTKYREFEYIRGLRVVVDSMNKPNCTFDLIELSPRLVVDITDSVVDYQVKKSIGSIDATKLPVGQLEAGTGTLNLFDHDEAFRENNSSSIIANHLTSHLSFYFWEVVKEVDDYDYFVPIKKLYSENKRPKYSNDSHVSYELRDLYYLFEKTDAPPLLLTDVSLSVAVATLLDNIGFSNYTFKRISSFSEPVIPYFFVAPDQNVAEVLQKLSAATQTAMFFDEYNNFTVMYREYMMPRPKDRSVDLVLDGDSDTPNIKEISSDEKFAMNKGVITYTERYIQRTTGSLAQQNFVNKDQTWIYAPTLLWEATGSESVRTINESSKDQSSYALGAIPLASDLSAEVPKVSNHKIINNTINFGDGVYWLPRFEGYFYAAGEIIKYDAVQYSVQGTGNVWITSNAEYQKYMAELPFNGKMYPTGYVRIFAEPDLQDDGRGGSIYANGSVRKHGRGQFGTTVTSHSAKLSSYWRSNSYIKCIPTESKYLFDGVALPDVTPGTITPTGGGGRAIRSGTIKNFMRELQYSEDQKTGKLTVKRPSIQASAYVFQGNPKIASGKVKRDYLTYSYKTLNGNFRHAGTRMRIVGQLVPLSDELQEPAGAFASYASVLNGEMKVLSGGSGGIAVGLNKATSNGYFFEVMAMSNANIDSIASESDYNPPHNVIFYKMVTDATTGLGVPVKLWGKLANVSVDSGEFVGASRDPGSETDSVIDLNVEYKNIGKTRRFYLYINDTQVAIVDDPDPLKEYNSIALFVRGTSKCMFENFYAIDKNIASSKGTSIVADGTINEAFGVDKTNSTLLKHYSLSGLLRSSYLNGINPAGDDACKIWYEEFGTIMRECAYFDAKYDRAYPALTAQISPTYNGVPGYTVSQFTPGPYNSKFLVFNATDKALDLGGDSANFLRIQGIAFTQNTSREYTLDDFYEEAGSLTDSALSTVNRSVRTSEIIEKYRDIKIKRMKYGVSEFSLQSDYIQTQGEAMKLMAWLADKSTRTRQLVGVTTFFYPILQLGDLVTISYTGNSADLVADSETRFVVYNIEVSKNSSGPTTTVYLSEV